jgi:hypothetical protein
MFAQQGNLDDFASMTLLEKQATLYVSVLWTCHVEWCFQFMEGLGAMAALSHVFVEIWACKTMNPVLRHYALRLVSNFCQVHPIYASIMADESRAKLVAEAISLTFSIWDVRALRHVLRFTLAAIAFALQVPVLPRNNQITVRDFLGRPDGIELHEYWKAGAPKRADRGADQHLFKTELLEKLVIWAEHPNGDDQGKGDEYSRLWALWLVLTILRYKDPQRIPDVTRETLLLFPKEVDTSKDRKKRSGSEDQTAAALETAAILGPPGARPTCCLEWLFGSERLGKVLSVITGICLESRWNDAKFAACSASGRFTYELPHFLKTMVHHVSGSKLVDCIAQPEKQLNLVSLMSIAIISSYKLQYSPSQTAEFFNAFFNLQKMLLQESAIKGEEPFESLGRQLTLSPGSLPLDFQFRSLVAYVIAQCVVPPLAEIPEEETHDGENSPTESPSSKPRNRLQSQMQKAVAAAPPVAKCKEPPSVLLRILSQEIAREDVRLRKAQHTDKGPIYSDLLLQLMYALAVTTPHHPSLANNTPAVLNCALTQVAKVFRVIENQVEGYRLYDPADGQRNKVFLYLRAVACVRTAIQCIAGSWLAEASGPHIALTDQAGKDFVRFCVKNIEKAYMESALIKTRESPWEKTMLSQGAPGTVGALLIRALSVDANLAELGRIGGQQSLLSLSRHGETATIKQQATLFLTKLAVVSG